MAIGNVDDFSTEPTSLRELDTRQESRVGLIRLPLHILTHLLMLPAGNVVVSASLAENCDDLVLRVEGPDMPVTTMFGHFLFVEPKYGSFTVPRFHGWSHK